MSNNWYLYVIKTANYLPLSAFPPNSIKKLGMNPNLCNVPSPFLPFWVNVPYKGPEISFWPHDRLDKAFIVGFEFGFWQGSLGKGSIHVGQNGVLEVVLDLHSRKVLTESEQTCLQTVMLPRVQHTLGKRGSGWPLLTAVGEASKSSTLVLHSLTQRGVIYSFTHLNL